MTPSVTEQKHSAQRDELERYFDSMFVRWDFVEDFQIDQIDIPASHRNQARGEEPIIPLLVQRYRDAMRNGDEFPALVGRSASRGKVVLVDGNNRLAATIEVGAQDFVPMYIVEADEDVLLAMTYQINLKFNGQPPSARESMDHALHLVNRGRTIEEAARITSVPSGQLNTAVAVQRSDDRARLMKIRGFEKLAKTSRRVMAQIYTDRGFAELARLAVTSHLSSGDVTDAVRQMQRHRTESAQVDAVERFKKDNTERLAKRAAGVKDEKKTGRSPGDYRLFLMWTGGLDSLNPETILRAAGTPEQCKALSERGLATADKLLAWAEMFAEAAATSPDVG